MENKTSEMTNAASPNLITTPAQLEEKPVTENIIDFLWGVVREYRVQCIPEGVAAHDEKWKEICTIMGWLEEDYKFPTHFD
jgi:hypothetical protein